MFFLNFPLGQFSKKKNNSPVRPAECALYFYNIPVENMKQMKTTTATKVGMSVHCPTISHISYTYQQHTNQFHL